MMQETKDERLQKLNNNRISLEMKGPMETMGRRMGFNVHNS